MTERQKRHIDALYDNCKDHLDGSDEKWRKALEYFSQAVHNSGDDPEMMEYAVKRIKELEEIVK
jgi:hypothetical protein